MTIKDAAALYGVSPQAIYQRLKSKGIDIRTLKNKAGDLTTEGERLLEDLFDRTSVSTMDTEQGQKAQQAPEKKDESSLLQVEKLTAEVYSLTAQIEMLKEERDYLRRALDQSQQLQAMTMRMLPPAAVERQGVFSWLASRFRKPAQQADQQQTGESQ